MLRTIKKALTVVFLAAVFFCGFTLGNQQVSAGEITRSLQQAVSEAVDWETAREYVERLTESVDSSKIWEAMGNLGQLAEKILE